MFNIGFSELIIVLLIAFLVVGPKDLPKVARWLGRMVKKLRGMLAQIKQETGWDELEKEFKTTQSEMDDTLNALKKDADVTAELREASAELNTNVSSVQKGLKSAESALKDIKKQLEE